jgi:hypothetical protein
MTRKTPSPDPHCTWRRVRAIKVGYHVLAGEVWYRVEEVQDTRDGWLLTVGGTSLPFEDPDSMWSRSPAEQFYAVSALLPSVNNIIPGGPMGNPFQGSGPSPIPELASLHEGWRG